MNGIRVLDLLLVPGDSNTSHHPSQTGRTPHHTGKAHSSRPSTAPRPQRQTTPRHGRSAAEDRPMPQSAGRVNWSRAQARTPGPNKSVTKTTKRRTAVSAYNTPKNTKVVPRSAPSSANSTRRGGARARITPEPSRQPLRQQYDRQSYKARQHYDPHEYDDSHQHADRYDDVNQHYGAPSRYPGERVSKRRPETASGVVHRTARRSPTPTSQVGDESTAYMSPAEIEARIQATLHKYGL